MATTADLLQQMYQSGSVLKGWDAVFNMTEERVNDIFAQQNSMAPSDWKQLRFGFCQLFGNMVGYTAVRFTLSNPRLQFLPNNQNMVQVTYQADGELVTAAKQVAGRFDPNTDCNTDDPTLSWQTSKTLQANTVTGQVPISQVQGLLLGAPDATSVVLDFPQGVFQTPFAPDAIVNNQLAIQLKNYFVTHDIRFVVQSVNLVASNAQPALVPASFRINTLMTNSGKNILQLFITTSGTPQSELTINVNEPIPDGFDCTLMINRDIALPTIISQTHIPFVLPVLPDLDVRSSSMSQAFQPTPNNGPAYQYEQQATYAYSTFLGDIEMGTIHVKGTGFLPFFVQGTGRAQVIRARARGLGAQVDISGMLWLADSLTGSQLSQAIAAGLQDVAFGSFSTLALESLLFPADELIQMREAYLPGDLLILGQIGAGSA